ncbi:hypothetical protein PSHT_14064 [Puccinia striiformis]|uniref:Uncharacterized protein n=1 Tax=Puccinia striiformis TaxID=27350 RepID=A0A2S4UM25_9BASI|nr:hypothetical protein PSHT_14064 [Puccinia striiformis]
MRIEKKKKDQIDEKKSDRNQLITINRANREFNNRKYPDKFDPNHMPVPIQFPPRPSFHQPNPRIPDLIPRLFERIQLDLMANQPKYLEWGFHWPPHEGRDPLPTAPIPTISDLKNLRSWYA